MGWRAELYTQLSWVPIFLPYVSYLLKQLSEKLHIMNVASFSTRQHHLACKFCRFAARFPVCTAANQNGDISQVASHIFCQVKFIFINHTYVFLLVLACLSGLYRNLTSLFFRYIYLFLFFETGLCCSFEPALVLALIDQASLELTEIHPSLSPRVLGWKTYTTTAWPFILFTKVPCQLLEMHDGNWDAG